MASYTIKSGDNLSRIAKQHGTTVDALAKANNISDPNKIRAGATLNIPGASTSAATGGSTANYNYGTGQYGGKYMGSNTTNSYRNARMDNPAGSTGYERGSVDLYKKNEDGTTTYSRTVNGVLPLGTSFRATGAALADAQNVPDSSGVFAYAKGRTPGYVEHVSGYKGQGYQDAKGNFYDANGNYLREDGHFYEPGASISKNGRYQDTGSGMSNAKYGVTYIPGFGQMYTQQANPYFGAAPNSILEIIDEAHGWSSGGNLQAAQPEKETVVDNIVQQIIQPDKKKQEDLERERYQQMMGGVW